MTIDEVIKKRNELEYELRVALSTAERSNKIKTLRMQIIENQNRCPHFSNKYNWAIIDDICPYCGFKFSNGNRGE